MVSRASLGPRTAERVKSTSESAVGSGSMREPVVRATPSVMALPSPGRPLTEPIWTSLPETVALVTVALGPATIWARDWGLTVEESRREVVDCPAVFGVGAATTEGAAPRASAARRTVVGAMNRRRRMGKVLTGSPLDTGPPDVGRPPEPTGSGDRTAHGEQK